MQRPYKLVEAGDELLIGVRFLRPALAALMVSVLVLFWGVVFATRGVTLPLLVVVFITSFVGVC